MSILLPELFLSPLRSLNKATQQSRFTGNLSPLIEVLSALAPGPFALAAESWKDWPWSAVGRSTAGGRWEAGGTRATGSAPFWAGQAAAGGGGSDLRPLSPALSPVGLVQLREGAQLLPLWESEHPRGVGCGPAACSVLTLGSAGKLLPDALEDLLYPMERVSQILQLAPQK